MINEPHIIPESVQKARNTLVKGEMFAVVEKPQSANLAAFMRERAENPDFANKVFLDALDEMAPGEAKRHTYTFSEFDRATNRFANWLLANELGPGASIGFIAENIAPMHITYIGCGKVGALCAPLNPKDSLEKWKLTFQDCKATAIVVQDLFFDEKFFALIRDLENLRFILVIASKEIPQHPNFDASLLSFEEATEKQSDLFTPNEALRWEDPFLLVYTSGTTGNPKGVVISLETIWRCAKSINDHFGFGPADSTFAQLSGFHVNHIVVSFWGALAGGYRCLMTNRFRPELYFKKCSEENISISSVVPTNLAYALKAEIESGGITCDEHFHQMFLGFFVEHFSQHLPAATIKTVWKNALKTCENLVDPVKFQEIFYRELLPYAKNPETFFEPFQNAFSLGFAKNFQPLFQKRYALSPDQLTIICGAGDLSLDLALQFSRLTGLKITQGWGMSEGTCYNSMSLPKQSWLLYWLTLGSIGVEMSTTNMSIVATDADLKPIMKDQHLAMLSNDEMAQNRIGMIAMRGAVSSLGYYKNNEANENSYQDGWLLTGDAGCSLLLAQTPNFKNFVRDCRKLTWAELLLKYPFVEERYHGLLKKIKETGNSTAFQQVLFKEATLLLEQPLFFIKGRIKDIIISKGQNIPCDEIEAGALSHAGIFESVAVGIADIEDSEVPGLVCTRHTNANVTAKEILEYTRDRRILPRLHWPVMTAIVETLPKTPTGKYQRVRAREVFADPQASLPTTTAQYGIKILDLAITPEYNLSRRPKS